MQAEFEGEPIDEVFISAETQVVDFQPVTMGGSHLNLITFEFQWARRPTPRWP
ncbi:MAG: hypothetical protein AAFY46_14510 [Planctomycetota bacterium]